MGEETSLATIEKAIIGGMLAIAGVVILAQVAQAAVPGAVAYSILDSSHIDIEGRISCIR